MDIRNILTASLESETPPTAPVSTEEAIAELDQACQGEFPDSPGVVDIVAQVSKSNAFNDQLITLDKMAEKTERAMGESPTDEQIDVAVESIKTVFSMLLGTQKVRYKSASMEAASSPGDRWKQLRREIKAVSDDLSKSSAASLESMYSDKNAATKWLAKENLTLKGAIAKAASAISAKKSELNEEAITLSHKGIITFLSRDGILVDDPLAAIESDLDILSKLIAAEKIYSDFYISLVNQIAKIGSTGKLTDLQGLFTALTAFDPRNPVAGLIGSSLLFSGKVELDSGEREYYDADDEAWYVLKENPLIYIDYGMSKGDGSKTTAIEKIKSFAKGGAAGSLPGLALGLFGGAAGAAAGAALGVAIGGMVGVAKKKDEVQGRNTNRNYSVDKILALLKACEKAVDMSKAAEGYEDRVYTASSKVGDSLKLFSRLINNKGNSSQTQIVINTGNSNGQISADATDDTIDQVREAVSEQIDAVYTMHLSVSEAIHTHTYWLARGGAMLAKVILDSVGK